MGKLSSLIRRVAGKKRFCSAVILAAGSGTRFDQKKAKQYVKVAGVPVLVRSVLAFSESELIHEIVVVTRKEDVPDTEVLLKEYGVAASVRVVAGGDTRRQSAQNGFEAISPKADFVAIHDAARCLVTPQMIEAAMEAAFVTGAAACADRTTDTLKRTNGANIITETIDRENVWAVQTPQIFRRDLYLTASAMAEKDGFVGTDDCMLVERIGCSVQLVDCGRTNLKITYPEDVTVAEAILTARKKEALSS